MFLNAMIVNQSLFLSSMFDIMVFLIFNPDNEWRFWAMVFDVVQVLELLAGWFSSVLPGHVQCN